MTGSVVARRYAKALFWLVRRKKSTKAGTREMGALEKTAEGMAFLAACVDASPELEEFFRNPVFTAEEKRGVINALADKGGISATVRDFACLLADKGRLGYFRAMAEEFQTMLDAEKGIMRGEFVSAIPLDEKKRTQVLEILEKKAGHPLALKFTVDPSILGGMKLRMGDTLRDASLNTQLSLLIDTIKRGE